jgi:hypothetical protein
VRSTFDLAAEVYELDGEDSRGRQAAAIVKRVKQCHDDYYTDAPAHFLRILSMAFPLASSSTSLSK